MDGVRMAVISNRFDAVVASMMNTIFRTGRSGVLNSAHDFSCCVLSAGHELVMGAESLPIHMMSGPDLIARAVVEAHPVLRRGDAFLHNNPYNGNSHPADHSMFVPVIDDEGVPPLLGAGEGAPGRLRQLAADDLHGRRRRRLRGGRAAVRRVPRPAGLRRQRRRPAHAEAADPRPGAVVGRLPGAARRGARRRAAHARAGARARLGRARDVRRRLVRLQRDGHGRGDLEAPVRPRRVDQPPRHVPRRARRRRRQGRHRGATATRAGSWSTCATTSTACRTAST